MIIYDENFNSFTLNALKESTTLCHQILYQNLVGRKKLNNDYIVFRNINFESVFGEQKLLGLSKNINISTFQITTINKELEYKSSYSGFFYNFNEKGVLRNRGAISSALIGNDKEKEYLLNTI